MSDQPVSSASDNVNVTAAANSVLSGEDVQVPQMDFNTGMQTAGSQAQPASSQAGDALAAAASAAAAADQSREAFDKDADLSHLLPSLGHPPAQESSSNAPATSGPGFFPPLEGMFPISSGPQAGGQGNIPVTSSAPHSGNQNGGFAFPSAGHQQPAAGEPFFATQPSAASTAGDIPTQPQHHQQDQNSSMPLLSKAAAESLAAHQFPPSTSSSSSGLNFPVHDHGAGSHGDIQSSTYDEISRTAPWLLSVNAHQAQPNSAARSTGDGHPGTSQPAFAPLPSQNDTLPVDPHAADDSDDEDDVGDDPNDQDYAPQAPGFMSNPLMRAAARNSMGGSKRTRNSMGGEAPDVPIEDGGLYLPESDEEDEYVQPSVSRKKPRKSGGGAGGAAQSSPGPHRCDFVDESGTVCDTPFKRPYDLARHKETKHGLNNSGRGKQEWICKNCKHNFSRKDALLRHQRVRHHS